MKQEKIVRIGGKKWKLPAVLLFFTGHIVKGHYHFYDVVGYRPPKAGEYYISGAIPEVYKAENDLTTPYLVAVPTKKARPITAWIVEGDV